MTNNETNSSVLRSLTLTKTAEKIIPPKTKQHKSQKSQSTQIKELKIVVKHVFGKKKKGSEFF